MDGKPRMVWVFNGQKSQFPFAVFESEQLAEEWIEAHGLEGTLTEYPVNISVYDYVKDHLGVRLKELSGQQLANFSSAYMDHEHY